MSIRDNRSHLITIWLYLTKLTLSRVRPKQSVTCNLATFYTNFFNECVVAVSKETMAREDWSSASSLRWMAQRRCCMHRRSSVCRTHACCFVRFESEKTVRQTQLQVARFLLVGSYNNLSVNVVCGPAASFFLWRVGIYFCPCVITTFVVAC